MITFYEANPALWNHGMVEYRDRNLPRALLQNFVLEFDEKFSEEEIKKRVEYSFNILQRRKTKGALIKAVRSRYRPGF